ncbi:MAG TPA: class II aldolase/adducin family protein [Terracidiphilus sp.]|jgi:L-fuculose-phosphate aldolase|nr:class II aldolase/adducin family protein [Terracidiphilus sp.]
MSQVIHPITDEGKEAFEAIVDPLCLCETEEETPSSVFLSSEADALRSEIIDTGRKLWERQYVDGNGGNISCRIGAGYILCTPTMISKRDLTPSDVCLSDMKGNIVAGDRLRTSEILLHLEIYRANPRARAIVHCHPPYATAYSLTGSVPPVGYISEYEILIGPAALAPYETPGTSAFAATVLPFVQDHNTILLANHGVVCWSDTITHAEWLVEVLESCCKTCLIAKQIGKPLIPIPDQKIEEILTLKRRLGFPDARIAAAPPAGENDRSHSDALDHLFRTTAERCRA